MFGVGGTELLVVLFIALLVFGPQKLPEIARQIGRAMSEMRRMVDDTVQAIQHEGVEEPKPRPAQNSVARPEQDRNYGDK